MYFGASLLYDSQLGHQGLNFVSPARARQGSNQGQTQIQITFFVVARQLTSITTRRVLFLHL